MTFDDIVDTIAKDLKLTSDDARASIGVHVNRRYRRVTAFLAMNVFRRVDVDFACTPGTQQQTIQPVVFPEFLGIERITGIFYQVSATSSATPLDEITYDEMKTEVPTLGIPTKWAKKRMGSNYTDFVINSTVPNGLTLQIEGEECASDLADDVEPAFSESYHDILIFGAKADQLRKLEKQLLARDMEADYDRVLKELALHISVGAFLTLQQNKVSCTRRCCRR
jgi:hypothetical protein